METDFPAIATGEVRRLERTDVDIYMDDATHMLTNPIGSVRLRAGRREVLEDLASVEGEGSSVLITGRYVQGVAPLLVVDQIARLDFHPIHDDLGGVKASMWDVQRLPSSQGPGDAWPWRTGGRSRAHGTARPGDGPFPLGPGDAFPWIVPAEAFTLLATTPASR